MQDTTETPTTSPTGELPTESMEEVAARQIAAVLPQPLRDRMEALRGAAVDLAQTYGPAVLDLQQECAAVEAAVNAAFGSRPNNYEVRYLGTGLDHARGVLGFLSELTEGSYNNSRAELDGLIAEYLGEQVAQ